MRTTVELYEALREALVGIPGIHLAFVFGSTARGTAREESDIDLFVVCDEMARRQVANSASESTAVLGREVNVVRYTPAELHRRVSRGDYFVSTVAAEPKQWLIGDERLFSELCS